MPTLTPKLNHDKSWYNNLLHENVCVVVFEKKDGTERTMLCTLKGDLLPPSSGTTKTVVVPDTQVRCFDIQKNEWRSFNTDSVISFYTSDMAMPAE